MKDGAQFLGEMWLRKLPGARDWEVKDRVIFLSADETVVEVPSGFVTDGASVPRLLWWIFPPAGNYMNAAVVHDACYRLHKMTRSQADWIMYEAMGVLGSWWVTRVLFWLVLRLFGWWSWCKN